MTQPRPRKIEQDGVARYLGAINEMQYYEHSGEFVIVTKKAIVSAEKLRATARGVETHLGGTVTGLIVPSDIVDIYELQEEGIPLDTLREKSKLATALISLENAIFEFAKHKGIQASTITRRHQFTIFGSSSLTLTLLPNRNSEDVDVAASDEFVDFVTHSDFQKAEMMIEPLREGGLVLLGQWQNRTCTMLGYKGMKFEVMHPLDTVMQKLLRLPQDKFETKDIPDIEAIAKELNPPQPTWLSLLTENPARYFVPPFGTAEQTDATKRNTSAFLARFLPEFNYDEITELAVTRHKKAIAPIARVESLPDFNLLDKITLIPRKGGLQDGF